MSIEYGFFNSINHDRVYDADDISNYFLKLISNGVFATPADAMQVQASMGMTVSVSPGWGFINCKWINNTAAYMLTLDAPDVVLNRIDRIVLRLNADEKLRNMEIAIKKGTLASNPAAPTLTRVPGGVWELSLARISVPAGVTEITQSAITDERGNKELCGWVTGLIDQIDTTNLFAQYDAAFWEWFNIIKDTVKETTLVRQYTSTYTTVSDNETIIPINISQYNETLDVLNVYINGLKLIFGVDYTITATSITLTRPLDIVGTQVEFEVLKSIDGTGSESVIDIVRQLQLDVEELENIKNEYLPINGNAVSATKLITPRNINGVPFDGTSDIVTPINSCYSFDNSSSWNSTPWHKVASTTIIKSLANSVFSFYVNRFNLPQNGFSGILRVAVRSGGTIGTYNQAYMTWDIAGEGIDPENFLLVYTETESTLNAEIWVKHTDQYQGWQFVLLSSSSSTSSNTNNLTLYNSTSGEETYTSGTGVIVSSLSNIQNQSNSQAASSTIIGGIKTGHATTGTELAVKMDSNNNAYALMPDTGWLDAELSDNVDKSKSWVKFRVYGMQVAVWGGVVLSNKIPKSSSHPKIENCIAKFTYEAGNSGPLIEGNAKGTFLAVKSGSNNMYCKVESGDLNTGTATGVLIYPYDSDIPSGYRVEFSITGFVAYDFERD